MTYQKASEAHLLDREQYRPVDWPRCHCCGDWATTETSFVCWRPDCIAGRHGFQKWLVDNPEPAIGDPHYDRKMASWLDRYRHRHWEQT
jgi:hypothetical protein